MLKRILRVVFSRTFAFALLALVQIGVFVALAYLFAFTGTVAYTVITVITVIVVMVIFEQDDLNPAYKLIWILVIVILPIGGALFYVIWGHSHVPRRNRKRLNFIEEKVGKVMRLMPAPANTLADADDETRRQAHYLWHKAAAPVYPAVGVEYYTIGEEFFPPFLEAIRNAKKYIFMEYFIVEEGVMWNTTLDILKEKAAQGVDVRFIYDGFGSMFTAPVNYYKTLRRYGIKCYPFSPFEFTVHLSDYAMLNHRDHRKITVVDGEVAFSGGLNFADEYINVIQRCGVWKDTAFQLRGPAVYSLVTTFLKAWDYLSGEESDYGAYRPVAVSTLVTPEDGFVQPYDDTPLDNENVSENAYLNIINRATGYVYISTPYLVLDYETITSLTLAAKSGVDVRILTPGIPDKPTIFLLTQSYYKVLLEGGVRIYEFTPGFNHGKMYVSDDKVAIVGSANMDYRSLYLHFENCTAFYGGATVPQVKQDMLDSFAVSTEITLDNPHKLPFHKRVIQLVVKFFAPIL